MGRGSRGLPGASVLWHVEAASRRDPGSVMDLGLEDSLVRARIGNPKDVLMTPVQVSTVRLGCNTIISTVLNIGSCNS